MNINKSIENTKREFETSFAEQNYYNLQTQDDRHLKLILSCLGIVGAKTVLDLGTGSGYLAFAIAAAYPESNVIGLDIVEEALKANTDRVKEKGLNNLSFIPYDGLEFPFPEASFDIVVSRYAIHHFPEVEYSMQEIARVLKAGGQLFISDPTPNENDTERFVDSYMKMKPDGHVRFYTENELTGFSKKVGLSKKNSFRTKIRFPRKHAEAYRLLITQTNDEILNGYEIDITNDEIYISEQVNNILFIKG